MNLERDVYASDRYESVFDDITHESSIYNGVVDIINDDKHEALAIDQLAEARSSHGLCLSSIAENDSCVYISDYDR